MTGVYQGRAWIELSRAALRRNVEQLRILLPPNCSLMPVVKANAYGHGAVLIARELNDLGVDAFCVATVFEGMELRQNGVKGEILILGYTHPQYVSHLVRYDLTQTVIDVSHALELNACGQVLNVHIKLDTGMRRLGERCGDLAKIQRIFDCEFLRVTGVYSHLYEDNLALPSDRAAAFQQRGDLYRTVDRLKRAGRVIPKVHILASGGLLHCPELGGDYARVGIALYGQLPAFGEWRRAGSELEPVLSLKARIALVRDAAPGEGVGYGHEFRAKRNSKIAVALIGYGDGIPYRLSNGVGAALVLGRRAPVAGRVCMDQTLLDVTGIPRVKAGDTAVFIGKSGAEEITAGDIAERIGTIPNELLSRLGGRLEREMV